MYISGRRCTSTRSSRRWCRAGSTRRRRLNSLRLISAGGEQFDQSKFAMFTVAEAVEAKRSHSCSGFPSLHPNCYGNERDQVQQSTSLVVPKAYSMFLNSKREEFNAAR
mmetsp:Transcript_69396/g.185187  ORF Transcript_69396/g.185187 Transcript_69396/m.185187 type:complete len:109 (+) Transcript_69396:40-366(+)